ncbi:MAG: NAD(P)H-hydrate dehydratase [Candidatus Sumerlaeia bacterium]|nr:NAD(P)H-hydrate dehydratase [Candidatus Sumerlaeia bacterium]
MKVVTEEQMREIDRVTIEERGVPGLTLMERAGEAVAQSVLARWSPRRVAICAGKGNNAGDGFVAARVLSQHGVQVDLFLAFPPEDFRGDAATTFAALPAKVRHFRDPGGTVLRSHVQDCDLVVDAVLGTGTRGRVRGPAAAMIEAINESGRPVAAIDLPSGLSAGNLSEGGPCVEATLTVTVGLPKLALVSSPGFPRVGEMVVADIGFPRDLLESPDLRVNLLTLGDVRRRMPARPEDSHKGTFGHLLLVAGSLGMTGAAVLAAQAAQRTGVGLVTVAAPERCIPTLEHLAVSAVKQPLCGPSASALDLSALDQLGALDRFDAVAIGPGLGQASGTQQLVLALIARVRQPLIIDADGLNALATDVSALASRPGPTVLTPHPKEMARLTGSEVAEIQRDRLAAARSIAEAHGVVTVLKGARTVIADPGGEIWINTTGNSGLAKGGSGDVLTGLVAGLAAQGVAPVDAALCAVHWHGLAADALTQRLTRRAMLPEDLIGTLAEVSGELGE